MKTLKLFMAFVLMTGLAVQGAAVAQIVTGVEVIEGTTGTTTEFDAEAAGEYRDDTLLPTVADPWGDLNDLRSLALQSDLVFHGVVTDIQYKLSEPSGPESLQVPFTFITYWVDQVILGETAGEYVTLRFIGGLDERTESYMTSSVAPEIDLGDEDILFVVDNTWSFCPLVGNSSGRLRIIDNQVFSETGREVTVDRNGKLLLGERHLLPQVLESRVYTSNGLLTFETEVGPDAVRGSSNAVSPDAIISRIASFELLPATGRDFVNADISAFIPGLDMSEAPYEPESIKEPSLDPEQKTDQEFEELEETALTADSTR